jgi:tetratricopeptide (TPR) repeat protein
MDLTSQAINAALCSDWEKAIEINSKILKNNCASVDCLNRLGKAYLELGESKKAATMFRKVLKIDKYDPIASRNLARATAPQMPVKKTGNQQPCQKTYSRNPALDFLEEPGKTKLINLVNLAPLKILLKQKQADQVELVLKRHTVMATDLEKNYLGSLPDDIGHRLSLLIKGGNHYCALIKSVSKNSLVIFVRETCRAKKLVNTPSFIANSNDYFSFVRDELVADQPTTSEGESDDDASSAEKLHADEEAEAQ